MKLSQFYVLSPRGDSIISRDFRGDLDKGTSATFFREMKFWDGGSGGDAPPVFHLDGVNYIYTIQNGLYFVLTSSAVDMSASLALELLTRLSRVFKDYCGVLSEESIRANFILIYELLDEILDFGFPQTTSTEILKAYVFNAPTSLNKKSNALLGALKWAQIPDMNSKTTPSSSVDKPVVTAASSGGHKRNEIFVDIYERVSVTLSNAGTPLYSQIDGTIQMKSYLSGNPELRLALNEKMMVGKIEDAARPYGVLVLDDCNFHECVNTSQFDHSRVLSLMPPDGEFGVMNYRATAHLDVPFRIFPFFEMATPLKCDLAVKIRADIPDTNYGTCMVICFPVPKATQSVSFDMGPDAGTDGHNIEYVAKEHRVYWRFKKFFGGKEFTLRSKILLSTAHSECVRKEVGPISMTFEIPMFNISMLQVRYLRIAEQSKSYNPFRWVRYVTKSGAYICRL